MKCIAFYVLFSPSSVGLCVDVACPVMEPVVGPVDVVWVVDHVVWVVEPVVWVAVLIILHSFNVMVVLT